MWFEQELDVFLRARFTLILVQTVEEERALESIKKVCERRRRGCLTWDLAEGFHPLAWWVGERPVAKEAIGALNLINQSAGETLYVLKDFHDLWSDPKIRRKLRSVAQRLKFTKKSIVILSPSGEIPEELQDEMVRMILPLPNADQISELLARLCQLPGVRVELSKHGREKLVQAALGLRASQAERAYATAIVRDGVLHDDDIERVTGEKQELIRASGALEFYPSNETTSDVGGLDVLKYWLKLRERAFSQEARKYGLPTPRGIALIGIPGTGKSLTAKMIGRLWQMPLLRIDVGALFGSMMGESEKRARNALRIAETIAPCVLWIDEMEKALAHGGNDSGTSSRVFGTILTWMQEKTAPVFVVATANDISKLPPELLRRGRFDEIFFLDLPTMAERQAILTVHFKKRKRNPAAFNIKQIAHISQGYVGAELEQAIIDAMYLGFNARREFTTKDVLQAVRRLVPLSVSQRERIKELRTWLTQGRAQSASFSDSKSAQRSFVPIATFKENNENT